MVFFELVDRGDSGPRDRQIITRKLLAARWSSADVIACAQSQASGSLRRGRKARSSADNGTSSTGQAENHESVPEYSGTLPRIAMSLGEEEKSRLDISSLETGIRRKKSGQSCRSLGTNSITLIEQV